MNDRTEHRWRLFIDESGHFGDEQDTAVAAGLLLKRDAPGTGAGELRRVLDAAVPGLFWPLHSAYLNLPVTFALHATIDTRATRLPDPEATRASALLRYHAPENLDRVLTALRAGKEPEYKEVLHLNRVLARADWKLFAGMSDRATRAARTVRRIVHALGAAVRPERETGRPGPLVFVAAEAWPGAAAPPDAASDLERATARYLHALEILLARVRRVLDRLGRHHVFLQVLERDVEDPVLNRRMRLQNRHVQGLLTARLGRDEPVRVVFEEVIPFTPETHPAAMLADFVANRARRAVCADGSLEAVERRIVHDTGGAVRSGSPARTHLAGLGTDARDPGGTPGRWALEEREEWESAGQ